MNEQHHSASVKTILKASQDLLKQAQAIDEQLLVYILEMLCVETKNIIKKNDTRSKVGELNDAEGAN